MARSLNRVQLIGNLTRDPELRYTPSGTAVCTFGLATNRTWTTDAGERHEEADFHRIIAWNKLGELCSQFLAKGRKVYVEGRLSTRNWQAQDGTQKTVTEVVIDDMILLDSPRRSEKEGEPQVPAGEDAATKKAVPAQKTQERKKTESTVSEEEVVPDDIPF